jgi:hypothetical protein
VTFNADDYSKTVVPAKAGTQFLYANR